MSPLVTMSCSHLSPYPTVRELHIPSPNCMIEILLKVLLSNGRLIAARFTWIALYLVLNLLTQLDAQVCV